MNTTDVGKWTILFFLLLTLLDLVVVEGYYRPANAWDSIWVWHCFYYFTWMGAAISVAVLSRSLLPFSLIVAFYFGIEDTVYYLLQFRLPSVYIGVRMLGGVLCEPLLWQVLILNSVGLILMSLLVMLQHRLSIMQRNEGFPNAFRMRMR